VTARLGLFDAGAAVQIGLDLQPLGNEGAKSAVTGRNVSGIKIDLARSGERTLPALRLRPAKIVNEYFNRQWVINYVGAVVLVVPVRLSQAASILGAGQ
jgi:hypothetical protein